MSQLRDKIYGREVATTPRKLMVTGRGGSGNARKSVSSASGESNTSGSSASVVSSHARTAMNSDRSTRTRRWSSASDDFLSVINISRDTGEYDDRSDLYTISSHSTSTNDTGALSDIPSFISEYTFKTNSNSNPSGRSRPSTMASNPSRQSNHSTQSDWFARIPRSYSSESLPAFIPETVEHTPIAPTQQQAPVSFFDPFMFGYVSQQVNQSRRSSELGPLDHPRPTSSTNSGVPKSPKRFRMFRKAPRAEQHDTLPPSSYGHNFPSQYGQSTETVNLRSSSLPTDDHPPVMEVRRRNSSALQSAIHALQRIG